ncbi:MAG TPA: radical SAM protein [Candidatus Binatia bacterium]|nr:radical SAM protein [Candidatus Binatia bacterium]
MRDGEHPARLKLELALHGVHLEASARAALGGPAAVDLELGDDVCVSAPTTERRDAPLVLEAEADRFFLRRAEAGSRRVVRALPPPRFAARRTSRGTPMARIATVRGAHLVVHPDRACGFSVQGAPCPFCVEGARGPNGGAEVAAVGEVVEVVRAAFAEGVAESVCFNSAAFAGDDGGIAFLAPYVEAVRMHFDTLVAAQVHPPRSDRWIDRTYALGVDAVSYNLELFDPDALTRHCVGRARYIGRERYLEALAYAAGIFPSGTVWTDLVLGLEPLESTLAGIEALAAAGVVPVVAAPRSPAAAADPSAVVPVLAHLYRTVRRRRINMGWVRDLPGGFAPLEARHFAGDDAHLAVALQALTRWRLGGLAARSLARVRRRLRVRAAEGPAERAHG